MSELEIQEMVRVAHLYYEEMLTQESIAKRLNLTRWKVGRMLREARELGIVKIEITHAGGRLAELESQLVQRFGLSSAVVVANHGATEASLLDSVGRQSAQHLANINPQPTTLGVGWGRTMNSVAQHARANWAENIMVVQMNGALTRGSSEGAQNEAAQILASKAGGRHALLPVPAIVDLETVREGLERDSTVSHILNLARSAPAALFSMGAITENSVLVESGYLKKEDVRRLKSLGAVGDVLGRFISAEGKTIDTHLDQRTLGLTIDDLKEKEIRIGITHGKSKLGVTMAALKSKLLTTLITDEETASYVVSTHD